MKGFTKCQNGHYYKEELSSCPYCHDGDKSVKNVDPKGKTRIFMESNEDNKTRMIIPQNSISQLDNRTVFGDEVIAEIEGKEVVTREYRASRKLVGWLVSYSINPLGVDFRLYEGRNLIGRDAECSISVPDKMMSGKHATILFKNDKYKLKDELSSHGTFVNEQDIEDETIELFDRDIIRMGETVFKFKSTL